MTWGAVVRFFFSLHGRIPRLPFIPFAIASYIAFVLLVNAWSAQENIGLRYLFNALILMVFPLKFMVTAKRWHDVGLSALCGFPLVGVFAIAAYANYAMPLFKAPPLSGFGVSLTIGNAHFNIGSLGGIFLLIGILLSDLALMVWPGNRHTNRYGPPAKRRDSAVAEHF